MDKTCDHSLEKADEQTTLLWCCLFFQFYPVSNFGKFICSILDFLALSRVKKLKLIRDSNHGVGITVNINNCEFIIFSSCWEERILGIPSSPEEFQWHFTRNNIALMASSPPGETIQRYFFYAQEVVYCIYM